MPPPIPILANVKRTELWLRLLLVTSHFMPLGRRPNGIKPAANFISINISYKIVVMAT
jgi:hypothetical protein